MKTTICIIALIALSSAVNLRMESEKSLSKLVLPNKEELFNYFPMLAQMTGPLEGVYDFINGLEDNLRNEQITADQLFNTETARCEAELDKRDTNIRLARKAFSYEQSRNAQCSTTYNNAVQALQNARDAGDTLESDKRLAEEQRLREANSYAKNVADNGKMIEGIDRALAYLAEMYSVSWRLDDGNTYLDDGYLIGVEDGEVFVAAQFELPPVEIQPIVVTYHEPQTGGGLVMDAPEEPKTGGGLVMNEPEPEFQTGGGLPTVNPTGGEKIFFAKRMKTHAISLIKIATSQGLLRETAPVIRFFTALIRMRQDKEQVGDFGEVGVNEEMVVKIFTLLMDLRVTATTNLRDLDKKEDQDAEDFVNAMNDFDAKMGENDGDIVDLEKLAEDSKKCRDESAGFMNDLGGPALENGVRSGGRIAKQESIYEKAEAMCDTFVDEYDRTTGLRQQQKGLLQALKDALFMKLDAIYGSARTRADEEKAEWDNLGIQSSIGDP